MAAIARLGDAGALVSNAVMLDFLLWDFAKANPDALKDIPVHHVRSIYY